MSANRVIDFFRTKNLPYTINILDESSATVPLAAAALGIMPALIAKSLCFCLRDRDIVVVTCGTARIDNRKFKDVFGCKAKLAAFDETLEITGYPVGGVCPFALPEGVSVYIDISLKGFALVYPAAGTANSAVAIAPDDLLRITGASLVDVSVMPDDSLKAVIK